MAELLMDHMVGNDILPKEQKAMRRGTRGFLDALIVDAAIAKETQ